MRVFSALLVLLFTAALCSCNDGETYGDKKEKERNAISAFIAEQNFTVISEAQFVAQNYTTDTLKREFVYLEKSGVYMQIRNMGEGEKLESDKQTNILIRYVEYNILDEYLQSSNIYNLDGNYNNSYVYDKMTVKRTGTTYTASFIQGKMYNNYGSSVPTGWLVPLDYINLGRPTSPNAIAEVVLIVPHSKGHTYASSSVYPCCYYITFEKER